MYLCRSGTEEEYCELEQLLEDIATFYEDVAAEKEVALAKKKLDAKKKLKTVQQLRICVEQLLRG